MLAEVAEDKIRHSGIQIFYDETRGGYVVDIDRSRLEGAPVYSDSDPNRWADPAYGQQIDAYYGI